MKLDLNGIYERAEAEAQEQNKVYREQLGNIESRRTTEKFLEGLDAAYDRKEAEERAEEKAKAEAEALKRQRAVEAEEAHKSGRFSEYEEQQRNPLREMLRSIGPAQERTENERPKPEKVYASKQEHELHDILTEIDEMREKWAKLQEQ